MIPKKFIITSIYEYLVENLNSDIIEFLSNKKFNNPRSKRFFYHGTNIPPNDFILRNDYDFEDSNTWSGDLPEGYLFLTTSIKEASAYGEYIIPCEFKKFSNKSFNVNANNPSQIFDKDYGIDLYMPDEYVGFWDKFMDSMKDILIIKGTDRWTLITDVDNVIPRADLAKEFYKK